MLEPTTGPCPAEPGTEARVGGFPMLDPETGTPLRWESDQILRGPGTRRWPVVAGIPFLRVGRDELRAGVVAALDAGEPDLALAHLLGDQDDFARTPPPDLDARRALVAEVDQPGRTLRDAMRSLHYGPVGDYFAYRWSAPTYLSGLALLDQFGVPGALVVETACGIGHYLRDLAARGVGCVGLDVVFSKLWLARRFVVPGSVGLVCGDAVRGWPLGASEPTPTVSFCQDAFYFLPDKPGVVRSWQTLVGDKGRILIGHAHNRRFDHRGVSGEPWAPEEYAAILPGAALFDDAALGRSVWSDESAPARDPADLDAVEAVALAWDPSGPVAGRGPGLGLLDPVPDARLQINPLLRIEDGTYRPNWPSDRFAAEYAAESSYLEGEPAVTHPRPDEVARLARRRILLDLPERW